MDVRRSTASDVAICQEIVAGLPEFFTDDVPEKVGQDLPVHGGWVVTENSRCVGFAVVEHRRPRAAEILWIAVKSDCRLRGLGSTLLDQVLRDLGSDGVTLVEAKTLDGSSDYEPYVATRSFWERHGFVQVDTIDPLPGWQPGNPAAIYVCALAPSR